MITMIANKPVFYAGKEYQKGEEFRVANQHVPTLRVSGLAREATAGPAAKAPVKAPEPEPPKRSYRRRDMVAESAPEPAAEQPPALKSPVLTTQDFPTTKKSED